MTVDFTYVVIGVVALVPLFVLIRAVMDIAESKQTVWLIHCRVKRLEEFIMNQGADDE